MAEPLQSLASLIFNQMMRAGQPRTVTRTVETMTPREPIDIGSLGLLIYFLLEENKRKKAQIPQAEEGEPLWYPSMTPSLGMPFLYSKNMAEIDPLTSMLYLKNLFG